MATIQLDKETFKKEIFDFENEKDWNFKGEIPVVVDFYADWCGPCKMVAPILEELSEEYEGKVKIYKVDTEVEQELSALFQIRSIPTMLFIAPNKDPMIQAGALPKSTLKQVIDEKLLAS
ncbi:MAG: thioredoxin [Crocinitomicaceae bacterium]